MRQLLHLCITFDHELFFGENYYSDEEILIKPTSKIVDILDKYNIKATFFTDVCSIDMHKNLCLDEYPALMEEQLKDLIKRGHDVQLHIHSNWYKSKFINKKWEFDTESFRIHTYGFEPKSKEKITANNIIKKGKEYLENILKPIDANYKCVAYRAGGFCIQPESELFKVLYDNNIRIDSSVAKGLHTESNTLKYSFLNMPKKINWWVSPEEGIEIDSKNREESLFEIPIGTINRKPQKWFISKKNIPYKKMERRGTYISTNVVEKKQNLLVKIINRIKSAWNMPLVLSLDTYRADTLYKMVSDYLIHNNCVKNDYYIAVIGHPKLIIGERLETLEEFVKMVTDKMPLVKFSTMQDVYKFEILKEDKK